MFVQKLYLRSNYIESNIEENIDLKNQIGMKKRSYIYTRTSFEKKCSYYIKKDMDFSNVELENIEFAKVNYQPAVNDHLTPEIYVDKAIDESSLVKKIQDNDFNHHNLTNIGSITLKTQAVNDNQVITRAYVDQFHQVNERSRRYLGIDFYDESSNFVKNNHLIIFDNDFNDNNLTNINSITINSNPTSDNEVSNKKISMMN